MTPAQAELLHHHRRHVAALREHIELLETGAVRFLRGNVDATADAIARAAAHLETLEALIDRHDPDGDTVLR